MKHIHCLLLTLGLASLPLFAQANPHQLLHNALVLENQGSFEAAAKMANRAIDSGQLSGVELGRAYLILGVACQGQGSLRDAQIAFVRSLHILERDPQQVEDYASALENYAGLYSDLGQLEIAAPMWRKALQLRQQIGDHTGVMLSLTRLAGLALARNRVHEAREYLKRASDEMKLARDLIAGDLALLYETQGWLALAEGHKPAAVSAYGRALELCRQAFGEQHWLTGWEHMLRGKAYAQAGGLNSALADMREGLAILDHALGRKNPRYFMAEMAYSQLLDRAGSHADAAELRTSAEKARKDYYASQCAGCTINGAAFR
jgi:tetratricopeptide (TPR) repeat protein